MLKNLLSSIPQGSPRYLGSYFRLLDTITVRMAVAKNKFRFVTLPRTQGIETLEWMIYNLNLSVAKSYKDDFELFEEYLTEQAFKYKIAFDPVATKSLVRNRLFRGKNGKHPTEIFFNSTVESPITMLPFGKDFESWKNVRSIRILYHNSVELPLDMNFGVATFVNHPPSFATVSINVPVLLMKWFKYAQMCEAKKEEASPLTFLKEYEYYAFFDDFVNVWITRLLIKVLFHKDASSEQIVNELDMPKFIADRAIVDVGVQAIQEVIKLIDTRALKFQDFLSCKFYPDGQTIRDKINQLEKNVILPGSQQYWWLNVLKSLPFFEIVTFVLERDPENPVFQTVMRNANKIWMRDIRLAKLPNYQFAGPVREYVELAQSLFQSIFESKLDLPLDNATQA